MIRMILLYELLFLQQGSKEQKCRYLGKDDSDPLPAGDCRLVKDEEDGV